MSRAGKAAIVGGGVIGGGWAARFLLNGWDAALFDPSEAAVARVRETVAAGRRALAALHDAPLPAEGRLTVHATLAEAVEGADWAQESVPERLGVKRAVLAEVAAHAPEAAVIGSSTSGFRPAQLQPEGAAGLVLVCHPFVPVYLLPLVEIVAPEAADQARVARCAEILETLGMKPLVVRKEIDAHIADRLLEAVWREALWLVKDGVCTTGELDDAIRYGFGLRWAQMGLFETYRIGGGDAGMRHFLAQFGPALKWPWSRLTDVPEMDDALAGLIADQSDAQAAGRSVRELERSRDDNLVAILRALRGAGWGAGVTVAEHEARLSRATAEEG